MVCYFRFNGIFIMIVDQCMRAGRKRCAERGVTNAKNGAKVC